ncbi:MAG: hypothetical protein CMO01_11525 [Thalassobius sp.]|nr:hypothetical protein [Thalassovita sp.]
MKLNKIFIFLTALAYLVGCADESLEPVLTYDNSGKGAYVKLISESDKLINVLNESTINSSSYNYSVEFVDVENGDKVTEYRVDLTYEPVSGSDIAVSSFLSYSADQFTVSEDGLKSVQDITITAPEVLSALGISAADLAPGDNFEFKGYVTLDDGSVFGYDNSSAAVRGDAFQAHFDFDIPAACPSDLGGTFEYTSSTNWCGGTASGTVDIVSQGGGVYNFSDWSFGAYASCYGGGTASSTSLTFTDVCTDVSFTGFTDVYGDTWTFTSTIEGNEWSIDWVNTYGETGSAVIYYTGGADWPIALTE